MLFFPVAGFFAVTKPMCKPMCLYILQHDAPLPIAAPLAPLAPLPLHGLISIESQKQVGTSWISSRLPVIFDAPTTHQGHGLLIPGSQSLVLERVGETSPWVPATTPLEKILLEPLTIFAIDGCTAVAGAEDDAPYPFGKDPVEEVAVVGAPVRVQVSEEALPACPGGVFGPVGELVLDVLEEAGRVKGQVVDRGGVVRLVDHGEKDLVLSVDAFEAFG